MTRRLFPPDGKIEDGIDRLETWVMLNYLKNLNPKNVIHEKQMEYLTMSWW
jgi:hypothetical protein